MSETPKHRRGAHPKSLANLRPMPKLPSDFIAASTRAVGPAVALRWWASLTPQERGQRIASHHAGEVARAEQRAASGGGEQ